MFRNTFLNLINSRISASILVVFVGFPPFLFLFLPYLLPIIVQNPQYPEAATRGVL